MKAFICMVEMYDGKKQPMRVFADTKEEARKKLIEQFPQYYVSDAVTMKEYSKDGDNEMINEVEQAFQQGYTQAKKEAAQALDKLKDKLGQAFSDAVDNAQNYWNPRVAQDALQDAYSNASCWIDEIFNGSEEV